MVVSQGSGDAFCARSVLALLCKSAESTQKASLLPAKRPSGAKESCALGQSSVASGLLLKRHPLGAKESKTRSKQDSL